MITFDTNKINIDVLYKLLKTKYDKKIEKAKSLDEQNFLLFEKTAKNNYSKVLKVLKNMQFLLENIKKSIKNDSYNYIYGAIRVAIQMSIHDFISNEKAFSEPFEDQTISLAFDMIKNYQALEKNPSPKRKELLTKQNEILAQGLLDSANIVPYKSPNEKEK